MKKIYCSDMGLNCSFVAEGMTEDEVVRKIDEHGKMAHPEEVKEMMAGMSEEEMAEKLKSKIKEE